MLAWLYIILAVAISLTGEPLRVQSSSTPETSTSMLSRPRHFCHSLLSKRLRGMSSTPAPRASLSHIERTAQEPRDESLHRVILSQIEQVNDSIRLLQLAIPEGQPPVKFLPGQWIDVYVPNTPKAGGFTITSPPSAAAIPQSSNSNSTARQGYLELAIQKSPTNPPAAWLWRPVTEIVNSSLYVRVGGSFTWPPQFYGKHDIKNAIFVAGGVGINPLMSILSHISERSVQDIKVSFLYSVKSPEEPRREEEILFLHRILCCFSSGGVAGDLELFLTGLKKAENGEGRNVLVSNDGQEVEFQRRRITKEDLLRVLGTVDERSDTVCYICGVPTMTDELVEVARQAEGMDSRHVLFERWW